MIRRFGSLALLAASQPIQGLVADSTKEIGSDGGAAGVESTLRLEQCEEAFLHDVLGIGYRPSEPPGKTKERGVVIVKKLEKGGFPSTPGVAKEVLALFHV
jgi:hypothetical protein